jgi:hypothetical protein
MKHTPTSPAIPSPWLILHEEGTGTKRVYGAFESFEEAQQRAQKYRSGEWFYEHMPPEAEMQEGLKKSPLWEALAPMLAPMLANPPKRDPSQWATEVEIVRDHPALQVNMNGIGSSAAWLGARDIWFERFRDVLEPHLRDPKEAFVFTFKSGTLRHFHDTYIGRATGPFPFPQNRAPRCAQCGAVMAFIGTLNFSDFDEFTLPGITLVVHGCSECGPCGTEDGTILLTWVHPDEYVVLGDTTQPVEVATRWRVTEYSTPEMSAEAITRADELFLKEQSIYFNFACCANKIGGRVFFIQGDGTPLDSQGRPMEFLCQLLGTRDVELGDSGAIYVFYSAMLKETKAVMQCF